MKVKFCSPFLATMVALVALFAANLGRVRSLGMADFPPFLVVVDAIPPALSNLVFNSPRDHTSLSAVNSAFYGTIWGSAPGVPHDARLVTRAIAAVLALDHKTISRETQLMSGDDKGIVDFVKVAFRLFGYHPERILYLYFLLLFGSILLLVVSFREIRLAAVIAAAFLAAHYLILPEVFFNLQLRSVLMPRFLPVLGLMACLHGLFFALRPRLSLPALAALLAQMLLLIFTLHLRAVTVWEITLVEGFGTALFLLRKLNKSTARGASDTWAALIPVTLLLLGAASLTEYRKLTYNEHYLKGDVMATRPFWHNILSGFAFNPELARQYGFKVDDSSEVRATGRFLTRHGRIKEWEAMGGMPVEGPWVWSAAFSRLRLGDYDRAAKGLIIDIMVHQPRDFFATYFYYKPRSLWNHLTWLYGFRRNIPDVAIYVSPDVGDAMATQLGDLQNDLDRRNLRFRLWDPVALATALACALIFSLPGPVRQRRDWAPLGVLVAGSLIPTTIGYAGMHTIAEPALMLAVLLYVLAAVGLAAIFRGIWRRTNPATLTLGHRSA
jgi:hypothetical protein